MRITTDYTGKEGERVNFVLIKLFFFRFATQISQRFSVFPSFWQECAIKGKKSTFFGKNEQINGENTPLFSYKMLDLCYIEILNNRGGKIKRIIFSEVYYFNIKKKNQTNL